MAASGDELHGIIIALPSPAPGKMQKVIFPPLAADLQYVRALTDTGVTFAAGPGAMPCRHWHSGATYRDTQCTASQLGLEGPSWEQSTGREPHGMAAHPSVPQTSHGLLSSSKLRTRFSFSQQFSPTPTALGTSKRTQGGSAQKGKQRNLPRSTSSDHAH